MDSKDLATQTLFTDLQFLRQYEGATWGNYQCTLLLMPLWDCANEAAYSFRLAKTIKRHASDAQSVAFIYAAFGINMPGTPSLLGARRREIAANYGVSISTVINRENKGLRLLAEGIVNDNPHLCGVTIPAPAHRPGTLESARCLVQAVDAKIEELSALQLRMRKRVGYS